MNVRKKSPPTVTDRKSNTNGGNLSFMMELNVGKYKVTRFTCDKFKKGLDAYG